MEYVERIAGLKEIIKCWQHRINENNSLAERKRCLARTNHPSAGSLAAQAECLQAETISLERLVEAYESEIRTLRGIKIIILPKPRHDCSPLCKNDLMG
jgi:hypothetical protein